MLSDTSKKATIRKIKRFIYMDTLILKQRII
jgi:hypothetical protein